MCFKWQCMVGLGLGALVVLGAVAQTPASQAALSDTTVLRGVRVIDVVEGKVNENQTIVIRRKKIVAVGAEGSIKLPKKAILLDWQGKTVMPGLINAHGHLGLLKDNAENSADAYTEANVIGELYTYHRYGVTTMLSLGLNRDLVYDLRKRQRQQLIGGATLLTAGRGIGVLDGAPPLPAQPDQLYRPATAEEARADVRALAKNRADMVKIWVDDLHGTVPKMSPEIYKAVIDEAHRHKLRVAAHVYALADAKELVASGVDVLGHSVRDREVDDELIQAMKSRGVWYIPTLTVDESAFVYAEQPEIVQTEFFKTAAGQTLVDKLSDASYREKTLADPATAQHHRDLEMDRVNVRKMLTAGVNVGFGTDSGAMPGRVPGFAEHHELELLVGAGLSPIEAIQCATWKNATLLHVPDRGVVTVGRRADLLVVDGDPLTDIRNTQKIVAVWHDGQREGELKVQ